MWHEFTLWQKSRNHECLLWCITRTIKYKWIVVNSCEVRLFIYANAGALLSPGFFLFLMWFLYLLNCPWVSIFAGTFNLLQVDDVYVFLMKTLVTSALCCPDESIVRYSCWQIAYTSQTYCAINSTPNKFGKNSE